jgi:hypothetical protein
VSKARQRRYHGQIKEWACDKPTSAATVLKTKMNKADRRLPLPELMQCVVEGE